MSVLVQVKDLVYEYPKKRALHGVSFEVAAGSVVGLVGPNGAGKSTLLRCMAALEHPFSGSITIDSLDTQLDPRGCHRRIGYLADFFGLFEFLTVKQSLTYIAAIQQLGVESLEQAVNTAIADVGLSSYSGVRSNTLSRGLRQRVAIAQALVHRPKLLLLDEPAAGLDPEARASLSDLIKSLSSRGITVIVSSHILAELSDYSTHMMTMEGGRILGYQQLSGQTSRGGISLLKVLFEGDVANLQSVLELAGATDIRLAPGQALFTFDQDRTARIELFRVLAEAQIGVFSLSEQQLSMQDVYFEQLKNIRKGPAQ